jgi:hypothetical protein
LADGDELRLSFRADRHFVRAARLEAAAGKRLRKIGRLAGDRGKMKIAIRLREVGWAIAASVSAAGRGRRKAS